MKIWLDGQEYTLRADTGVNRSPMVEWPDNTRLDGQQYRKDRRRISTWVIDDWSGGFGVEVCNVNDATTMNSFWDCENLDTRFPRQITLSPAFVECTLVPSRGDLDHHFVFGNQLFFAESQRAGTAVIGSFNNNGAVCYKYDGNKTIGSNTNLTPSYGIIGSLNGIISSNNKLGIFLDVGGERRYMCIPTLGGGVPTTWRGNIGTTGARYTQMVSVGGTMQALDYDVLLGKYRFYMADQDLLNFAEVGSPGIIGAIGTYLAPLVTDGADCYAALPDGVYDFDASPQAIIDSSRTQDLNPLLTNFGGYLHYKNKTSLLRYNGATVTSVGYDTRDGLPADKMGQITALCDTWKFLFAAVKGATYSHILSMDKDTLAWQYYARAPSVGMWVRDMFISNQPDGLDRLWLMFGNHANPGYFREPLINPTATGAYRFTESTTPINSNYISFPKFDGGLAEEEGAFFDVGVTIDGIVGVIADYKPNILYGVNEGSAVSTLGVIGTIGYTSFLMGSPYGVQARRVQVRLALGTTTPLLAPNVRQAIVHYLKKPNIREEFDFEIDLRQTAVDKARALEDIIGSLNYERGVRTLMPFWYGGMPTKHVAVVDMPSVDDLTKDNIYQAERTGFVRVKVSEIIV